MNKNVIEDFLRLTKQQSIALQNEDIILFQQLMDQKQLLIDGKIKYMKLSDDVSHEIKVIIQEIKQVDKQNKEEFFRQFQQVKDNLYKIRMMKKSEKHYTNTYSTYYEEGFFIDKR